MARVLTIASQKGGVGKTTTALNLGYTLSRLGETVLLVDADPQGGMTIASNLRKKSELGLVQYLREEVSLQEITTATRDGTMGVVGSGVASPEDTFLLEESARDGTLAAAIKQLSRGCDYVFIDAPAGVGGIVNALLKASSAVILVISCRSLFLKSLPLFLKLIRHVRAGSNPTLRLEGGLVTMWEGGDPLAQELLGELTGAIPEALLFRTIIPYDGRFEQASVKAMPVAMLTDGREAGRPYLQLALEIKERELLRQTGGVADEHFDGLF